MRSRGLLLLAILVSLASLFLLNRETGNREGAQSPHSESVVALEDRDREHLFRRTEPERESPMARGPELEDPEDPSDEDGFHEEALTPEEQWSRYEALDPVQKGPCTLVVTLLDSVSGQPVSGFVDLWRLDVPGNDWWTEGDQKQRRLEAENGILTVRDLPAGHYRAYVYRARRNSESAPAFQVKGRRTVVQIQVELPKPERIRLHLVDMHGSPIQSNLESKFEVKKFMSPEFYPGKLRPKWISPRMPTDTSVTRPERMGEASMAPGAKSWTEVEHLNGHIDLGEIRGDPREYRTNHHWKIRSDNERPVSVWLTASGVSHYVAILPSPDKILESITRPEGLLATGLRNEIQFSTDATPIDFSKGESISSRWPLVVIGVGVRLKEFENISVKWKPGKESMPPITLQRQ